MTDALPPPEVSPEPQPAEPEPPDPERATIGESRPPRKWPDPLPILFGIGVIVLLAAVFYLWQHPLGQYLALQPTGPAEPAAPAPVFATAAGLAALAQEVQAGRQQAQATRAQVEALQQRVEAIEKRPAPPPADLGPLETRVAAIEKRLEQQPVAQGAAAADVAALASRLDALAARQEQLANRDALEASRAQELATQVQQLAGQVQSGEAAASKRLQSVEARLAAMEQDSRRLAGLADRASRVAVIEAAGAALDAGQPVGQLPGAPPALARFATEPPPTVASLRLAFPAAARAAQAAAQPEAANLPFWQAVEHRLASLVTIRRGDQVIVGEPTAIVLARASRALDAGDLAGAVAAVAQLQGQPAAAAAGWRAQAEALMEARRALAALAAHAALTRFLPARA